MQPRTMRMTALLSLMVSLVPAGATARATAEAEALEKRVLALHEAGRDDEALAAAEQLVRLVEDRAYGKEVTANAYCYVAYGALCVRKPEKALAAAEHALGLVPQVPLCHMSRAHALLFLGREREAKSIYMDHKGERIGKLSWEEFIGVSFREFRARGLDHPRMARVEKAVADAPVSARAQSAQKVRSSREGTRQVSNACRAANLQCIADCGILDIVGSHSPYDVPGECQYQCDAQLAMCLRRYH